MPDKTQNKPTIKEWVADLRSKVDIPPEMEDADVFRQILEVDPSVLQQVQTTQEAPVQGSAAKRFAKGMGAMPAETVESLAKGGAFGAMFPHISMPIQQTKQAFKDFQAVRKGHGEDVADRQKEQLAGLLDLPKVGEDISKGDWAHAAGRATTQGIMVASMLTPLGASADATRAATLSDLDEMLAIGRSSLREEGALNAAKLLTKSQMATLDTDLAGVQKVMANRLINAKSLRAAIDKPMRTLKGIERAPEAQVKGITAAKEALSRLEKYANRGMVPWQDAQNLYKELNAAEGGLGRGASQLRDELRVARKGLGDELASSAKAAGQGAEYGKWVKDYSKLSDIQRAYVRIVRGETPAQLEAGASSKPATSVPFTRGAIKVGGGKAAKAARAEIKAWHKGLQELDKQIKTKPTPTPATGPQTPQPPAPPAGPQGPGGGGAAPPAGGGGAAPPAGAGGVQAAPVTPPAGGSGGPMSSLVDKVMGQQKPISETQQAINDILRPEGKPKGPLPPNVVEGQGMGLTITEPGTGPARILQWPKPKPIM